LLTVGFGDINGKNIQERIFCICWIVFAVSFYSYSVGNVTGIIASMDDTAQSLQDSLSTLQGLKTRLNMPPVLVRKIKRHLENNQQSESNRTAQE